MRSARFWCSVSPLLGIAAFVSCGPGHDAAVQLDRVAKSLDRYGFANISAPFLAAPSDNFQFDLNKKADEFFEMAFRPQGAVRGFSAEALDVQLAFRVNIEQALSTVAQFQNAKSIASFRDSQRKAALHKGLLESLSTANPEVADNALVKSTIGMLGVVADQPEPSTEALPGFVPTSQPIELGAPIPEEDRIALRAVGPSFTSGLAFPEGSFRLSAREALLIASGDSMTQSLLRWFSEPTGNKLRDYELFFCPMIVSVQPGCETRDSYLADVTVDVDLARSNGNGGFEYLSKDFNGASPPIHVAGVFPVIDSQVLDLVSSRRKLFSLAFQLSMLGFGAQADAFVDYARKLEQDAKTQTALTVASAYTIGSTSFGFRIEPKFVALTDLASIEPKPGRILESKTFPALTVLLVHQSYLHSKLACNDKNEKGYWGNQLSAGSPRSKYYDFLSLRTSVRWSPVQSGSLSRLSEVEVWRRAEALDEAEAQIEKLDCGSRRQQQLLESRSNSLGKLALDNQTMMRVWHTRPRNQICIHDVRPDRGWVDQYTVLTIRGSGFEGNVKGVTVGGIRCEHTVVSDRALLVAVPPWGVAKAELPKTAGTFGDLIAQAIHDEDIRAQKLETLSKEILKFTGAHEDTPNRAKDISEAIESLAGLSRDSVSAPLSPEEQKLLDELLKKVGECKLGPDSKDYAEKWKFFEGLLTRSRATADAKKQREASEAQAKKGQAFTSAWAEVVIASSKPVRLAGDKACKCDAEENDEFPEDAPDSNDVPAKLNPFKASNLPCAGTIGWVLFDKKLASAGGGSGGSSSQGSVKINRDPQGRITGIETGDGGFANGAQLLQMVHQALANESCGDVSMSFSAEGAMEIGAPSGGAKPRDAKKME